MVSKAIDGEGVVFGDEFVADEILTRLPARCAVRCTVLSKRFRQLVASEHFWLRHCRLGAPLELPHAARLYRHGDHRVFDFHVVGPTFVLKHAVKVEQHSWYASTCNGLVLLSCFSYPDKGQTCVDGIVFNPATKEETRLSLPLLDPPKKDVKRYILGFGYGPLSKVYKALIREADANDKHNGTRFMVVSMDSSGGQEPRTVLLSDDYIDCENTLHTADGKVYFLIYAIGHFKDCYLSVLAFDVDSEAVTRIAVPEGEDIAFRMLEVRGRPCIYTESGRDTVLWFLTMDYRWEKLCILVKESTRWGDFLLGAWDCGGGLLFAEFSDYSVYMYNLHQADGKEKVGSSGSRLTAISSLKMKIKWYNDFINMWDYQPTLISPTSIFGDAAFSGCGRVSVAPRHEVDGKFLEMTHEWIINPMMHMLSVLRPRSG